VDRMYLLTTMENLEKEKNLHAEKFGGNPIHANCLPNFEQAIAKLGAELEKLEAAAKAAQLQDQQ
jgi:hypothetical protein